MDDGVFNIDGGSIPSRAFWLLGWSRRTRFGLRSIALTEIFCVRRHGGLLVKGLAVAAKAAGFRKVEKEAGGREVMKEANQFGVNPFDEVLIVGLVGGYIPFANVVGLTGVVSAVDSTLLEKAVLERFII
jgi:hypothetical protein